LTALRLELRAAARLGPVSSRHAPRHQAPERRTSPRRDASDCTDCSDFNSFNDFNNFDD
jgi:hypothetical protein